MTTGLEQQMKSQKDQLVVKQEYFRNNIQHKDYDKFSEFCLQTKGNLNIALWTISEVQQLVSLFHMWKEYFGSKVQDTPKINRDDSSVDSSDSDQPQKKPQNAPVQSPVIQLTPTVVKVKPAQDIPIDREQSGKKQPYILSGSQVLDLLTFSPDKEDETFQLNKSSPIISSKPTPLSSPQKKQETPKKSTKQLPQNKQPPPKPITQNSPKQQRAPSPLTKIIKLQPINEQNPPHPTKRPTEPSLSQSQTFPSKTHQSFIATLPKVYKQQFDEIIQCRKSQPVSYSKIKIVSIKRHEIVQKAFFLPDYVMYHVELQPLNVVCKRNYDDFKRLYDTLVKFYPGTRIPYLQSNSWLSETNIQFIKKQKVCLEYFLNQLIRHQSLRDSLALYQFLTVSDHKAIKRKFQQYDAAEKPKSLEQLSNGNGMVKVKLSNADHHFIKKSQVFNQEITTFLGQYNDIMVSMMANYDAVTDNLSSIAKLIKGFKKKTSEFQQMEVKLGIPLQNQLQELPATLKILQKLVSTQLSTLSSKRQLIYDKLLQYTQYQHANVSSTQQLLSQRQYLDQAYHRRVETQPTSPSTSESKPSQNAIKNYLAKELKDKKNGLIEVSDSTLVLKYHLAYLNCRLKDQFIKMFEYFGRGLRQTIAERVKTFLDKENNFEYQSFTEIVQLAIDTN